MPKISALPPAGTLADDDETPFVDDSVSITKKFTLSGLKTWLQSLVGWISTAMLADASVTPAKVAPNVAVGTINANSSGSVTGLAFKPKKVTFFRNSSTTVTVFTYGVSIDDGGSGVHHAMGTTSSAAGAAGSTTNSILNPTGNGTTNVLGKVTAFNSDGFTYTMSVTANVNYTYIAEG